MSSPTAGDHQGDVADTTRGFVQDRQFPADKVQGISCKVGASKLIEMTHWKGEVVEDEWGSEWVYINIYIDTHFLIEIFYDKTAFRFRTHTHVAHKVKFGTSSLFSDISCGANFKTPHNQMKDSFSPPNRGDWKHDGAKLLTASALQLCASCRRLISAVPLAATCWSFILFFANRSSFF